MAISTESNDSSDLFWPGYVDAVTNLAINLLFVIAVMSIVVIGVTIQIAEVTKAPEVPSGGKLAEKGPTPAQRQAASTAPDRGSQEQISGLQQALIESRQSLEKTQRELQQTKATLLTSQNQVAELLLAKQNPVVASKATNRIQALAQQGVMVIFSHDVMTLSQEETTELIARLTNAGTPMGKRWEISIIAPKGLSESLRVAYYRAHAVRNAMLVGGISNEAIDIRIHESVQAGADNSQVLIRWRQ